MKNILQLFCIGILFISLFNSCGIEKRKYRSGYNIDWNKSNTVHSKKELDKENQLASAEVKSNVKNNSTENSIQGTTLASVNNLDVISNQFIEKSNDSINKVKEDCDIIILKNGEEIKAKVSEISKDEIKYKKCEDLNGLTYALKKSEVFEIKYPNGTKDLFPAEKAVEKNSKPIEEKSGTFGILSIVFFGLGLIFPPLLIPSLIFAIVGVEKNRKHRSLAIATLVGFGVLILLFFILILAFAYD